MSDPSTAQLNTAPTALLADDEEAPREQLLQALQLAWPALRVVAVATHGVDAWDAYLEHEPDLCFLDIRMPGLTGIDVARRIDGRAPVVFVTAFGDHALAAFDAGAVDYLVKPVEPARLAQTVARLQARMAPVAASASNLGPPGPATPELGTLLHQLSQTLPRTPRLRVLQASVGREVRLIPVDEVIYFESDARYTRVVHAAGDALIRTPLKELLPQLDDELFWQVHRSVIVNHRHVAAALRVDEGQMQLSLRGRSERLPVSRHFQGLFKGQ